MWRPARIDGHAAACAAVGAAKVRANQRATAGWKSIGNTGSGAVAGRRAGNNGRRRSGAPPISQRLFSWQMGRARADLEPSPRAPGSALRPAMTYPDDPELPTLRQLARGDLPLLAAWLRQAHVARWWDHATTPEAVEADFGPGIDGTEPVEQLVACLPGRPFGFVQRYGLGAYPEYRAELAQWIAVPADAFAIDYFVGEPGLLRRGLGTAMVRAAVAALWQEAPRASSVVVAVNAANLASWRTLERAGFRLAGRARLAPDNPIDGRDHVVYRIDRPA